MRIFRIAALLWVLLFSPICPMAVAPQPAEAPIGVDGLTPLDKLPLLRWNIEFGSVSSQDVTGGNKDGCPGAFSYLYPENGRWVLLDLLVPGDSENEKAHA